MTKQKNTYYDSLKSDEKKKVRRNFEMIIKDRKKQIQFFEESFILPQKKMIKLIEETLKSQHTIEECIYQNDKFSEWLIRVFKEGKEVG